MNIEKITSGDTCIAAVFSSEAIITDVQSALDLIMTVKYDTGAEKIAINKDAITESFFILSSGLAGEVLQKFINYRVKLAIYGDYSKYNSKPLHDFIYESNCGSDIFFTDTKNAAVERMAAA